MNCPKCGGLVAENSVFCGSCGTRLAGAGASAAPSWTPPPLPSAAIEAVPAPPPPAVVGAAVADVPLVEPVAAAPAAVYASLGGRALAAVLDLLTFLGCYWFFGSVVASRVGGTTASGFAVQGAPAIIIIVGSMVAWLVFYVCFEWWFGATPGKWAAGLRVTTLEAARPSLVQAVVRNVARIIDGFALYLVGAILVLLTKRRQRLGDLVARTVVVKRHTNAVLRLAAVLLALALPVAGVAATWYLGFTSASLSPLTTATTAVSQSASTTSGGGAASPQAATAAVTTPAGSAPSPTSFAEGPLTMSAVRLAASKEGPERANRVFKPGEAVVILFSLSGMTAEAASAGHTRMKVRVLDPFQVEVVEAMEHEDRLPTAEPVPSWLQFSLPEYCIPGQHRLEIVLEDLAAKRQLQASVPFTVDAAPYEPSDRLVVQSLHLTEGEHGAPRASASYPRGGTVWMALQAVGFKTGSDGAVKVRMDVSITKKGGDSVGDLHLLTVEDKFFYAPRRIPMTANLTLGQLPAGEYTATVRASDDVGQQKAEQAISFTIAQ